MNSSPPQVCLITGGSSGVGLATAETFARAGSHVAICGRDAERLESAHDRLVEIAGDADKVLAVQADITVTDEATGLVSQTIEQLSRIDLLVNNAAMAPMAPLDEMPNEAIDACIDLNVRATYYVTRSVWGQMKQQGSGIVVNISSQAAVDPFPGFSLYGSTKAWMELFTVALAGEGREHGIRSYCIRPGAIETPMLRGLFADFPAEQCVSPQEVADAIWAVTGPELANSSGQIIRVSKQ
ncbi:MAG: SDR family NAD(P)-dependent oxidoreductase [Pirellulaceae bacterium]